MTQFETEMQTKGKCDHGNEFHLNTVNKLLTRGRWWTVVLNVQNGEQWYFFLSCL